MTALHCLFTSLAADKIYSSLAFKICCFVLIYYLRNGKLGAFKRTLLSDRTAGLYNDCVSKPSEPPTKTAFNSLLMYRMLLARQLSGFCDT